MAKQTNIGQLDRKLGIYEYTKVKSATGEIIDTPILYKNAWLKIDDKTSKEDEDGKLWLYAQRNYTIRYDINIMQRGEQMFVRDMDGDFYITGIEQEGRKRYLILKALKRE